MTTPPVPFSIADPDDQGQTTAVTPHLAGRGSHRSEADVLEEALFEAKRILVGQDRMIERLFICWLARGHCLLEGAPGLAKTLAAETVARILGGTYARIQFTPDLVPADLVGTRIYRPSQAAIDRDRDRHRGQGRGTAQRHGGAALRRHDHRGRPAGRGHRRCRRAGRPGHDHRLRHRSGDRHHRGPAGARPADEASMEALADATGGAFFTADSSNELAEVYDSIQSRIGTVDEQREMLRFFVGLAVIALMAAVAASMYWNARFL